MPDRHGSQQWLSCREETNQVHEVKRVREGNDPFRRAAFGPSGGAGENELGNRCARTSHAREANRATGAAERAAETVIAGQPETIGAVVGDRAGKPGRNPAKGIARQRLR